VGEREDHVFLLGQQRFKRFCFLERKGQRLVADHVDAGIDEGSCGGHMHVVRRDDRHRLDAVGTFRLCLRHFLVVGTVAARGIKAQILGRGCCLFGIGRERACHKFIVIIHAGGEAMHSADEGPLPATHHAEADAACVSFRVFL
jgi:hypothetical protein